MLTNRQIRRLAVRIAHRKLRAAGKVIPEGTTYENKGIRAHRFRHAIKVWDLTNAGKRGKKVDIITVYDLDYLDDEGKEIVDAMTVKMRRANFARVEKLFTQLLADLGNVKRGSSVKIERHQEKGVRVDPLGTKPIRVRGSHIAVRFERQSFWVRDLTDELNEPTLIPRDRKATATKKMYAWAKGNKAQIKSMTFNEMQKLMESMNVDYHYFLAVD
jgi:hypothetical protein